MTTLASDQGQSARGTAMEGEVGTTRSRSIRGQGPWIFSPAVDLFAFLGSAVLSLVLLLIGATQGWLNTTSPEWTWVTCVLAVDVAHVWSTAFRAYFEPVEWNRRPMFLLFVPIASAILASSLYSRDAELFWRCLAYLAVWHFLRQQQGWVAWYRRKGNEPLGWELWVDRIAIYAAMLYPLVYWHTHLPRQFDWFTAGDFALIPKGIERLAWPIYLLSLTAYGLKSLRDFWRGKPRIGKDIVVITTAMCWYLGIVTFNSDYAFTVTNVLIHGIPYLVLIIWYRAEQPLSRSDASASTSVARESGSSISLESRSIRGESEECQIVADESWSELFALGDERATSRSPLATSGAVSGAPSLLGARTRRWLRAGLIVLATVWLLAYLEELLWDRFVWQERSWLFGVPSTLESHTWLTPLLAVPQITHYLMDGFLWRRSDMSQSEQASESVTMVE